MCADGPEAELECAGEWVRVAPRKVRVEREVAVATFQREAVVQRDGFEQRGSAGTVFAGEEGQTAAIELQ